MERRLAAILAADVVGYSRLIQEDEAGTLATLKAHREELIEPKVTERNGRIVKLMGDGILAEFPSAVEAVQCAVEVQHAIGECNADVPEGKRIIYRVGVNVGDVVVEDDDIFGDGVIVAARLEGLAEPGGICISQQALDQVEAKLGYGYEDLGEQNLKNIEKPVQVYRVLSDPDAAQMTTPAKKRMSGQWRWVALAAVIVVGLGGAAIWTHTMRSTALLPETTLESSQTKIAIAVLPFVNRSADPEQDYFADGITEDLITDLAKFPGLQVTARTSTATYKGRTVDVRKISEELGVEYLVEGSVEKSAGKVRVTAQLIDAASGGHIWAERYDRDLTDIFAIRDEIRTSIVGAITGQSGPLFMAEMERATRQSPDSVKARDLYYQALSYWPQFSKEANAQARVLLERSIELDPDDAGAHALLAWTHFRDDWIGWGDDPAASRDLAMEAAEKAVALDNSDYRGHHALGAAFRLRGDFESAALQYDRAFELNPHDPDMLADWGEFLRDSGEVEKAIEQLKRAMALNPHYPDWYLGVLATAYFFSGQYEEAIRARSQIGYATKDTRARVAVSHVKLGRMDEARAEVEQILETDPGYSISEFLSWDVWESLDPQVVESYADALREAGLPE